MSKKIKKEVEKTPSPQKESEDDVVVREFLEKRLPILRRSKKNIIDGFDFQQLMKDADREFVPHTLSEKANSSNSYFLDVDDVEGIRGERTVQLPVTADEEWRSDRSAPTLLTKVGIVVSIFTQQNPTGEFKALLNKYKKTKHLAKAIYMRSWDLAMSREQLAIFMTNLAKYGWAPARTYPRIIKNEKEVLTELDVNNPENNKYEKKTIVRFNDVYREALDPHRTWIDDMANLYDPWSLNDWFFEKDYSKETFENEFGHYKNAKLVTFGNPYREAESSDDSQKPNDETESRTDIITLSFYENQEKDLYAIYSPKDDKVIYSGPLPNDEGLLSYWDAYWTIRDPRTRYGLGLYEIIKNDKVLYDRLDNMTMDQLVMAVYKMLFYSGPNQPGDGTVRIQPGVAKQKLPGTTIDVVDVPFESESWKGLEYRKTRIDEASGVTPTLEGVIEGKTLGEVLHAKDSALKRLNIPLANIASALERDAELTLSWANQIYSLPEIMEFQDEKALEEFEKENEREATSIKEDGGKIIADFPRQLDLSIDEGRDGELIESPNSRFFVVGKDIKPEQLKWKGRISISVTSMMAPSQELDRQRKMELYNLVSPVIQVIAQSMAMKQYDIAVAVAKPVVQILEIQDEKPEDWLPENVVTLLENPDMISQMQAKQEASQNSSQSLMVSPEQAANDTEAVAEGGGQQPSMPQGDGLPQIPRDEISNPMRDSLEAIGGNQMKGLM